MPIGPLKKKYLGEILLGNGLITKEQLKEALAEQQGTKEKLGAILIRHNYIVESDLLNALAVCYGLPLVKLSEVKVDEDVLKVVNEKIARRFSIMPLSKKDSILKAAMADPSNVMAVDEIERSTGLKLSVVLATDQEIKQAIDRYYSGAFIRGEELGQGTIEEVSLDEKDDISKDDVEAADAAPVIKYVNALFFEAISKKASDIHIEPEENGVSLRMRLDGRLKEFPPPPKKFHLAIVSRIKIIANLDIAERRLPQDGKCKIKIGDKKVDIRVSTLPTVYGEKVVLRVLDRGNLSLKLEDMGLSAAELLKFKEALDRPFGMILVTGPTSSGKTTTLYTGLNYINVPDRNIVTVEDPVEYELKKINQVQVKPAIGLTFAHILRSVLRQDPDVIMVGEIRDKETAEIAIQAALTGHLVLSTLHTNDAVSSLSRLRYMGIEPFLIADAVELVIAQRLVRLICPACREEIEVPEALVERLHLPAGEKVRFFRGRGCNACFGTGYHGRIAVTEVLRLSPDLKKMLVAETADLIIKEAAIREGMRTLRETALDKLKAGLTTVEEVLSVTSST